VPSIPSAETTWATDSPGTTSSHRWPSVTAAAKKAYGLRYQLLTYLYSSLYLAHSRGGTLARPLLFTDPVTQKQGKQQGTMKFTVHMIVFDDLGVGEAVGLYHQDAF